MNLNYTEQERQAYISGNTNLADTIGTILDLEGNEEDLEDLRNQLWSAESDLDCANEELERTEREITRYKEVIELIKGSYYGLPLVVQNAIQDLDID